MTETNRITCPSCGQSYAVRPEQWAQYQGRTINCTKCGNPFVVSAPAPQPPAVAPAATPPGFPPPAGEGAPQSWPAAAPPPTAPPAAPPGYAGHPTGYGAYPPGAYPPAPPTESNGMAVASLVFGIVGFCIPVVGSLVAIITGIIGLSRTKDPRVRGRGMAIAGLTLGIVSILIVPLMIGILLPSLNRAREQANRIKCAANLRQLGMAMQMYANQYQGHYPDELKDLTTQDLTGVVFICPDDDKQPASGSAQAMAAQIATGQHSSYVYVGNGLMVTEPADTVLIYEPLADHKDGMNVLFGDGHVDYLRAADAKSILDQQAAGKHPISLNPTR